MELNQIPQNPNNWGNVADLLNENSGKIEAETAKLNNVTTKFKGYFTTSTALSAKWPSPIVGDTAWVGETYPGVVYRCDVAGTWLATTDVPPSNTVNLSEYATQDAVSNEFASVRSDLSEAQQAENALGQRITIAETNVANNKTSINTLNGEVETLDKDINLLNINSSSHLGEDDAKFALPQNKPITLNVKNTSGIQFQYYIAEYDVNNTLLNYINPNTGEKSSGAVGVALNNKTTNTTLFTSDVDCGFVKIINYGETYKSKTIDVNIQGYYGETIDLLSTELGNIKQNYGVVKYECVEGINVIPFKFNNQGRYLFKNISATLSGYISFKEQANYVLYTQPRVSPPATGTEKFIFSSSETNYLVFNCTGAGVVEITDLDSKERKEFEESQNIDGWKLESSTANPISFNAPNRNCNVVLQVKNNTEVSRNIYIQLSGYDDNGTIRNYYLDIDGNIQTSLTWVALSAKATIVMSFTTPEWLNSINISSSTAWSNNNLYISLIHDAENVQSKYNDISNNKDIISAFIAMLKTKKVDPQYNRLSVVIHGDSILGSQLSEVTNAPDYNVGSFPPNMSRMIVARKFYDKYKFSDEDTVFRNLKHSDWTKTGKWNTVNGFNNTSFFNKSEVWSCESGATAIIDTFGYKYVKMVWSEYLNIPTINDNNYSFTVEFSKDDFVTIAKTEPFSVVNTSRLLQRNRIFMMPYYFTDWQTEHYKLRITPTSNYGKALIWGVEMWNNPRLDVTVEAFSGSTALMHKLYMLDSYNSTYIKPHLIICDTLVTNDSDYINRGIYYGELHTISNWFTSYKEIFDKINTLGIPVIMFAPHSANTWLTSGAESIIKKYNAGVIDIYKKMQYVTPRSKVTGADGVHLSNYGISYYFEELEKIFDN